MEPWRTIGLECPGTFKECGYAHGFCWEGPDMSGLGQPCVIINPQWFQIMLLETHSYILSVAFAPEFNLPSSSKTGYTVYNLRPSVFCSFANLGIAWWNLSERSSSFCLFLKWPSSLFFYLFGLSIKNQLSKESLDIVISLLKHFHF